MACLAKDGTVRCAVPLSSHDLFVCLMGVERGFPTTRAERGVSEIAVRHVAEH